MYRKKNATYCKFVRWIFICHFLNRDYRRTKYISKNLSTLIQSIKKLKNIPLVIGFGISTEEQVKTVTNDADGVIVGSHLVKLIESFIPNENQAINALATRVQELKNATL